MAYREFADYIDEKEAADPEFAAELAEQRRLLATATERPCSVGDCVGLFSAEGVYLGGWGPVDCPHEEVDW